MLMSYSGAELEDYQGGGDAWGIYIRVRPLGVNQAMKHVVTVGKSKSEESFPKTDHFGGELKYFSDCIVRGQATGSGR